MPTLDCNFSCVYCYEDKKPGKMGFETMNLLKKWISIEIPKFKLVLLSWFGGEPLLDIRTIEEFTSYANTVARENGIELIAHITTNGYSLSKEKIQRLIELKIFNYQITIDGIAETHNKLRPLKNGKQTFDKIFNNINLLTSMSPLVKVTLRVNFNHTNLHTVPVLLEMFPLQGRHQLRLALEPIFGSCEYNAVDNMLTDDISMTLTSYLTLASELGYDISVGKSSIEPGKLVYCYAERENQVVINFNGDIFKCSVTDFNKSNRVGYLDNNGVFVKNPEAFDKWMNIPLFEPFCKSCKFLPLCMGGCRKARVFDESTGSFCSLIPTNASYVLKQIAYKGFDNLVLNSQTEFL